MENLGDLLPAIKPQVCAGWFKRGSGVLEPAIMEYSCGMLKPSSNVSLEREFLRNISVAWKVISPLCVRIGEMGTRTTHTGVCRFETIEATFFAWISSHGSLQVEPFLDNEIALLLFSSLGSAWYGRSILYPLQFFHLHSLWLLLISGAFILVSIWNHSRAA